MFAAFFVCVAIQKEYLNGFLYAAVPLPFEAVSTARADEQMTWKIPESTGS